MKSITTELLDSCIDNHLNFFRPIDLSDLTIIIPTYERPNYLLRQIAYLSKWHVSVKIVDGSSNPLDKKFSEYIKRFPHITYVNSPISYTDRIQEASDSITTSFAMCLADDDIYLQSGLLSAIKTLKTSDRMVACMGQSFGFDTNDKNYSIFNYGDSLREYVVNGNSVSERILNGIRNYRSAASYAVFKTPTFKRVWTKRASMPSLEAIEYEHAIRTYAEGELATTPDIYWLRSFESQPIASEIEGSRQNTFEAFARNDRYKDPFNIFRARIIELMSKNMPIEMADATFDEVVNLILGNSHTGLVSAGLLEICSRNAIKIGNIVTLGRVNKLKGNKTWVSARNKVSILGRKKVNLIREFNEPSKLKDITGAMEFAKQFSPYIR
jgi:glycosyltransferase domain-containing protein